MSNNNSCHIQNHIKQMQIDLAEVWGIYTEGVDYVFKCTCRYETARIYQLLWLQSIHNISSYIS